jgi:hypothetical protein
VLKVPRFKVESMREEPPNHIPAPIFSANPLPQSVETAHLLAVAAIRDCGEMPSSSTFSECNTLGQKVVARPAAENHLFVVPVELLFSSLCTCLLSFLLFSLFFSFCSDISPQGGLTF